MATSLGSVVGCESEAEAEVEAAVKFGVAFFGIGGRPGKPLERNPSKAWELLKLVIAGMGDDARGERGEK